jgi:hypothetical protein
MHNFVCHIAVGKHAPDNFLVRGAVRNKLLGNIVTKVTGWRSPTPNGLRDLGLLSAVWRQHEGASWLLLICGGQPLEGFNPEVDDLATRRDPGNGGELTLFDTSNDRTGKPLVPPRGSWDDPDAWKVILRGAGGAFLDLAAALAPVPKVSGELLSIVTAGLDEVAGSERKDRGLRIARHRSLLSRPEVIDIFRPRREYPLRLTVDDQHLLPAGRETVLKENLGRLMDEGRRALKDLLSEGEGQRLSDADKRTTSNVVEAALAFFFSDAINRYKNHAEFLQPMPIRLLRFEGGPEQFVGRAGSGERVL